MKFPVETEHHKWTDIHTSAVHMRVPLLFLSFDNLKTGNQFQNKIKWRSNGFKSAQYPTLHRECDGQILDYKAAAGTSQYNPSKYQS